MTPRLYQKEAINLAINYMSRNPDRHGVIAMPTGTGKSLVIAEIAKYVAKEWKAKVLIISHSEEILKQDYLQLSVLIDDSIGLYSAGLNLRDIKPITIAGIQSVFRKPELFLDFKLIIIDECHMISYKENSMYRKFLNEIGQIYIGLTATPYRLSGGLIYGKPDSLFNDMIYDLTSLENFNMLIDKGYLCNLKVPSTALQIDTSELHHRGGEFIDKEMSDLIDRDSITKAALIEILYYANHYKCKKWLIFAIDIVHAEHIAEALIALGIPTGVVHSKMEMEKSWVLDAHKAGTITALVNVNMLTTGYDDPEIDLIVMLRPTESPVLHVQSAGRGTRIAPGKEFCIFLDFAGNTKRLGPINAVQVKESYKLNKEIGNPIYKICPECECLTWPAAKYCKECGYTFTFETKLESTSSRIEVISENKSWYNVDKVHYEKFILNDNIDTIKCVYRCGVKSFNELFCLDHRGYARTRAVAVLMNRGANKDDLIDCKTALLISDSLKIPKRVLIDSSIKYPRVLKYEY